MKSLNKVSTFENSISSSENLRFIQNLRWVQLFKNLYTYKFQKFLFLTQYMHYNCFELKFQMKWNQIKMNEKDAVFVMKKVFFVF